MSTTQEENAPRWAARLDLHRSTKSFSDLIKIVQSYYDMYDRGVRFIAPWISKQNSTHLPFISPSKDALRESIGKPRTLIHSVVHHGFINETIRFVDQTKGKRTLISPHPTTHHSAQFSSGTFSINKANDAKLAKRPNVQRKSLHEIVLFGADEPVYVENLQLNPEQINFIIVRPKIGKLGTANLSNWEVLLYKHPHQFLINHVDSDLNPRFAGIL